MGLTTPTTDPPTAAECNTEAEATAGMDTAARMTRVRAAGKNAGTNLWRRQLFWNNAQKNLSVTMMSDRVVNW